MKTVGFWLVKIRCIWGFLDFVIDSKLNIKNWESLKASPN